MRRALFVAIILTLALPASAETCQTVTFGDKGTGTQITSKTGNVTTVHTAMVGTFLWVNYGEAPEAGVEWEGTAMVDVSDPTLIAASVCPDGTVTFDRAAPEATVTPEAEIVDLVEQYPTLPDVERPDGWTLAVFPF